MSVFKKIKDTFKEVYKGEGLMNDFCEHLRQIGINATLLESGSPEAIGPRWKKGPLASGQVLGCVKVGDRNIDLVQVERVMSSVGGDSEGTSITNYLYDFVVRANVEGLEDKLKAKVKPIGKGFLSKEVVDFKWEGGELAQLLNADSDLKNMMLREWLNPLVRPNVEIKPDEKYPCVRIMHTPRKGITVSLGQLQQLREARRKTFPTREDFEIYDRIAQHIRSIASAQP